MKKLFGILCLVLGTALAAWLGYNFLVERQPATENLNPVPAVLFTLGLLYVGTRQLEASPAK